MLRFMKLAVGALAIGAGLAFSAGMAMADVQIQGGGATFPNPAYQQWIKDFGKLHPDIKIDYASKGSGAGVGGIIDKTFDFAGSDAPMTDDEIGKAKSAGGDIVEFPSVAGAVVAAYNLPSVKGDLKLNGDVLAKIYLGQITKWDDDALKALNPGLALPGTAITTVHRSDGSGTNFVFTSYLSTQNDDFQTKIGIGKSVNWVGGQGGNGNQGVTQAIQKTEGAIGYIELNYALDNKINFALMQNTAGNFVKASPDTVSAAGESAAKDMDAKHTLAVRLWTRDGDNAYPIASFTYLIAYKDLSYLKDEAKAQALVDFLWYGTHDGQKAALGLSYAPLSAAVQQHVEGAIETFTFNGKVLHPAGK
jgi:phosphate transport system substrate-binding protein